ncbi:MAG: hypothetical protein HKN76_08630, partial [Saprospiraceae bacterium]|nr:hypothetical protein [Saprospiraceae bacterium]
MKELFTVFAVLHLHLIFSQVPAYYGGGNSQNVTATSSSNYQDPNWSKIATAQNTLNSQG